MKLKFLQAAVAGLMLSVCNVANAGLIINDSIEVFDGDGDGFIDDLSVSQIQFHVTAGTELTFDVLSLIDGPTGIYAGFDSEMYLFSGSTLQGGNDDGPVNTPDGGIVFLDPFFSYNFSIEGDYLVTIGHHSSDVIDALRGYDIDKTFGGQLDITTDWQLTLTAITGQISNVAILNPSSVSVPEPSTLAIFSLGIMGLASRRFKKK